MKQKLDTPLSRIISSRNGNWLVNKVEEWQENSHKYRSDSGWFHPSSLSVGCDAYLAFQFLGVKPKGKISAKLIRIFDNGKSRDRDWKRYLKKSKLSTVKKNKDRKIEIAADDYPIRGEVDDIVQEPSTGELFVFEFKTINHDQFKALRQPLHQHCVQVTPYMVATGLRAIILYEDKNTQDLKWFIYQLDMQLWAKMVSRLSSIKSQLDAGQIPLRSRISNEQQCPFYYCCHTFDLEKFCAKEKRTAKTNS